jgi:hypothetical protein
MKYMKGMETRLKELVIVGLDVNVRYEIRDKNGQYNRLLVVFQHWSLKIGTPGGQG